MNKLFLVSLLTTPTLISNAYSEPCDQSVWDVDCVGCVEIRTDYNVLKPNSLEITPIPEALVDIGNTAYNCASTPRNVGVSNSVRATESVSYSDTSGWTGNVGISAGLVAGGSFGLNSAVVQNQSITSNPGANSTREDCPPCEGITLRSEWTTFGRRAVQTVYRRVSYVSCDVCTNPQTGAMFEDLRVTYYCEPEIVQAEALLVKPVQDSWFISSVTDPARAPSNISPSGCNWCGDQNDGGVNDLDPDEDEDNDGIPNGQDDRPYGYEGDDPDGDADGDGISNAQDDSPFGYEGDDPHGDDDNDGVPNNQDESRCGDDVEDPNGDDDGDGIPNCEDPFPNGEDETNFIDFDIIPAGHQFKLPAVWIA